jgi:hypothetical protein
MLIRKRDGSVETQEGRIVLFSVERFLDEIANGDSCFICGAKPGEKEFNSEHVIPDWVLRNRGLHSGSIVLPNKASITYGRCVIRCCQECNENMANIFEVPISEAFARGYEGVTNMMRTGRSFLLWLWLALVFLKLHLKDRDMRWHLNRSLGDAKISDAYNWTQLYHIHCIVRAFYTGAVIDPKVHGSLFVWPASDIEGDEEFDLAEVLDGASILIRIGPVFALAALNDSGFAMGSLGETLEKIAAPLTRIQGRELLAKLCHRNLSLEPRPRYHSEIDFETGEYHITAEIPEDVHLIEDHQPRLYGAIMAFLVSDILEGTRTDSQILQFIREGRYTFLFGEDGTFLAH